MSYPCFFVAIGSLILAAAEASNAQVVAERLAAEQAAVLAVSDSNSASQPAKPELTWRQTDNSIALPNPGLPRDGLTEAWTHPPQSAKPWTYWYWMNNSVSKEGITRDLEAMADHGIGGVYLFSIGGGKALVDPPVPSLSPAWWEHIDHALGEADRLGIKIRLNACDGWATAAAPTITPELSMQELVWSKAIADGGRLFDGGLRQPVGRNGYYRDLAVLAYPEMVDHPETSLTRRPTVHSSYPRQDLTALVTGSPKGIELSRPGWFQYEFDKPLTCRAITVQPSRRSYQAMRLEVQVSDDGKAFRSLGHLPVPRHGWQDMMVVTSAIPATKARIFRFVFDPSNSEPASEDLDHAKNTGVGLRQVVLDESPVIHHWRGKAGFAWRRSTPTSQEQVPDALAVPLQRIVDLTRRMMPDGRLRWEVPPGGRWVVQRIGYTTTGAKNGPAGAGIGLEADKFNSASAPVQFDSWFGKAVQRHPQMVGHALAGSHTDSWECRSQNWSPVFRDEFERRRGYDPIRYLPAMSGVPIESTDVSERFLHDVRQTIAELVPANFFAPMVGLVHGKGADFSAECMAPTMMCDGMALYRHVDLPMGEFWFKSPNQDKPNDILDAVHGARLYGKPIVQAEAFTQVELEWDEHPFQLKAMGDHNFAQGINRLVLHVWAMKALERAPGVTLGGIGSDFSRMQTWWKPARAWFDYLRRCQAVLQRGSAVADVLYYVGEDQPTRAMLPDRLDPALPAGYTYGSINRDALLTVVEARDHKLVLPGGMTYRVLVLPPMDRMTPEVARRVAELARAGVPILGPNPSRSPSLRDYPRCDEQVRRIVAEGWGNVREASVLATTLVELKLAPDLVFTDVDPRPVWRDDFKYRSPPFSWGHRRDGDADIYFISNQEYAPRTVEAVFRTHGKQPELWDPGSGQTRPLSDWSVRAGRTHVPLQFAAAESFFIVFRSPADPPKAPAPNFPALAPLAEIAGPWKVAFPPDCGLPAVLELPSLVSLHTSEDAALRRFSGTATYRKTFDFRPHGGARVYLDLGRVANLAEVTFNGRLLGPLWKPPFRIEVTGLLKAGENTVGVAVSTTWHNRMVADANLPLTQRVSSAPFYPLERLRAAPLVESGLLGPVQLMGVAEATQPALMKPDGVGASRIKPGGSDRHACPDRNRNGKEKHATSNTLCGNRPVGNHWCFDPGQSRR